MGPPRIPEVNGDILGTRLSFIFLFWAAFALAEGENTAVYAQPRPGGIEVVVGPWLLPAEPPEDSVRVEMVRCQICQSDRRVLQGTKTSTLQAKPTVLGHEGVGRVSQLPRGYQGPLKVGDLVVLLPHYVKPDDPYEARGVPNLSPNMKHLGFHINGVFADKMDFPSYSVYPLPNPGLFSAADETHYLDQMVKTEPLACTLRGYKKLSEAGKMPKDGQSVLILGAGPMGILNAMYLQRRYPNLTVSLYDSDPKRRDLAKSLPNFRARVLDAVEGNTKYDLVVTVMSDPKGNAEEAPRLVADRGAVLLFSGINLKPLDARPLVAGLDIETVHRREGTAEVEALGKRFTFVGTSGYVKADIADSIAELREDFGRQVEGKPSLYRWATTTGIAGLGSHEANDLSGSGGNLFFPEPAIKALLETPGHEFLKIMVRQGPPASPLFADPLPPEERVPRASKELAELSCFLEPVQKAVYEKFGIRRIYLGGGSARAVLDHLFRGGPLNMRDLDVFMTMGRKVAKVDLEALADRFEADGVGKVLRSELQPRIRNNMELSGPESQKYVTGYGFTLLREGGDLDLSIYNDDKDHRRNGIFDIDTLLVPLDHNQSLLEFRRKALRVGLKNLVANGLLVDEFGGYGTWVNRTPPRVVHWEEIARDPVLQSIRSLRSFQKVGIEHMPQAFAEKLRALVLSHDGDINRRSLVRNLVKLLGDESAATELRELMRVGTFERFSPPLAKALAQLGHSGIEGVFLSAAPVPGAKLSDVGLGRLVALGRLVPIGDRSALVADVSLLEPQFGALVSGASAPQGDCGYSGATPGGRRRLKTSRREEGSWLPTSLLASESGFQGRPPADLQAQI